MKPYAVFLRLPCESIPPRQRFHLADNLITAREFNAHVRPAHTNSKRARTILMMKFVSCALYAVPRIRVQSEVFFGL